MNPTEQVRILSIRKEAIETELDAQLSILSSNSSTLRSPLVDPEGFPRSDIDVFAVRGARVRIIELRNDLKAVVDEIGTALESVYDKSAVASGIIAPELKGDVTTLDGPLMPFARVDGVAPNSPAAAAVCVHEWFDYITQITICSSTGFAERRPRGTIWASNPAII